ncbi:MAG: hypothetical protein ACOYT7_02170 [Patescibacteria group bacterium]
MGQGGGARSYPFTLRAVAESNPADGTVASGEKVLVRVSHYCPPEWEFGTRLVISGREWVCMDRGGAIQIEDGIAWIDMLTPEKLFPHGSIVEAYLVEP